LVGAILAAFWVQHLGPEMLDLIDHCQGLHPQARERRGRALDHKIKLGLLENPAVPLSVPIYSGSDDCRTTRA
jgi:hypothetical protein